MKTKLLAAVLALGVSFSASAEWSINKHGIPVVSESKDFNKVMALYGVCDREIPVIALGDLSLPADAKGVKLSFKARIDKRKVYQVSAVVNDIGGGMMGVYLEQDKAAFESLLSGENIRFQFKADQQGKFVVEKYSLSGITKAYMDAGALCDAGFFDEQPADDNNYFES